MFFRNDDYIAPETALLGRSKLSDGGAETHNDVRAHVEREFSMMEQEHARIRLEALAAHLERDLDD